MRNHKLCSFRFENSNPEFRKYLVRKIHHFHGHFFGRSRRQLVTQYVFVPSNLDGNSTINCRWLNCSDKNYVNFHVGIGNASRFFPDFPGVNLAQGRDIKRSARNFTLVEKRSEKRYYYDIKSKCREKKKTVSDIRQFSRKRKVFELFLTVKRRLYFKMSLFKNTLCLSHVSIDATVKPSIVDVSIEKVFNSLQIIHLQK